jgi:hypothetical protein
MRAGDATGRTTVALGLVVALLAFALLCCEGLLSIDGPVVVAASDAADASDAAEGDSDAYADAASEVGPPGTACGLPVAADAQACQACAAANCCSQAGKCAMDPACAALESCLLGCGGDYACRAACVIAHPVNDSPDTPALDTCISANCTGACGLMCGMAESFTVPDAAQLCQQCLDMECPSVLACATNLQCQRTERCFTSCSTRDCWEACLAADDGGFSAFAADEISCITPCQIGTDFRCVGKVAFPLAEASTSAITIVVNDGATPPMPLPGLSVKACLAGQDPCSAVAAGMTDAMGSVTLQLPDLTLPAVGFGGYFEITSTAQPPSIVPYLYFLSYPLSVPYVSFMVSMQTPAHLQSVAAPVGVILDDTHGTVIVESTDCQLLPASQVQVAVAPTDSETRFRYIASGVLSATATSTDISGAAFVFDVPPGMATVTATPLSLGHPSSQASILVRAGAMSYVEALPTPGE